MAKNDPKEAPPSTELATTGGGALAEVDDTAELQAFLAENKGSGLELLPSQDMVFPRLLILQPMSPLVTQKDQQAGTIANSLTEANYGNKFDFFLLHAYPTRARWLSPDPGSDLDCTSADYLHGTVKDQDHGNGICAACPFSQWVGKTPPSCTDFRNLVLIPAEDEPTPIIYSTSRSGLKPVAQFTSDIRMSNKPVYFSCWRLETVKNIKDSKVWYTPRFTKQYDILNPNVTPQEALARLKQLKNLSDMVRSAQDRIVLNPENEAPEHAAGGAGDEGEGAY